MDDHKKYSLANGSKSDPTFLLVGRFVPLRQGVGILESKACRLKTHTVLQQVPPVLGLIPLKAHGQYPALSSDYLAKSFMSIHMYVRLTIQAFRAKQRPEQGS
jgi:hypothetical protein